MRPNNSGWTVHSIRANAAAHPRRTRLLLAAIFVAVFAGSLFTRTSLSQRAPGTAERFRRMSEDFEQKGLVEPFKGITPAVMSHPACSRFIPRVSLPSPCAMRRRVFLPA
jgi:hypothetical protein